MCNYTIVFNSSIDDNFSYTTGTHLNVYLYRRFFFFFFLFEEGKNINFKFGKYTSVQ
jgi:hypothetical protein